MLAYIYLKYKLSCEVLVIFDGSSVPIKQIKAHTTNNISEFFV